MKSLILITSALLAIQIFSFGQSDSIKIKLYDSWYDLYSEDKRQCDLYTYELSDSTVIVVAKKKYNPGIMTDPIDLQIFPVEDINTMLFRKKGSKATGFLTGLFTGAALGVIVGLGIGGTYYDIGESTYYSSAGFKACFYGLVGAGIGIAIGGGVGTAKKDFIINGNFGNYQKLKPDMSKYSIRYNTP